MIKLLHVDDDADILELSKMALGLSEDFEVVACLSGMEALSKASQFTPDVFLLDVMMPGMTGPETLARLRSIPGFEDIPVIFMTARLGDGSREELLSLGAKEVIAKPFDPITLGTKILSAMNR